MNFDFSAARKKMVRDNLAARGIKDADVLKVMGRVPREKFIEPVDYDEAYADKPLGIACGQTISQPYIVALMTELLELKGAESVLEIGTGSGYQTAILAELASRVYTVERHAQLGIEAQEILLWDLGYDNIDYKVGDGTRGWPQKAPFDAIIVTAGAPVIPESLKEQLADGGRLVIPVGKDRNQVLTRIRRKGDEFIEEPGIDCIFVKLIGEQGYSQ